MAADIINSGKKKIKVMDTQRASMMHGGFHNKESMLKKTSRPKIIITLCFSFIAKPSLLVVIWLGGMFVYAQNLISINLS